MKMKIERIRAVNFLSHSDTEVDLRNVDSVVAVGNNGAGKSSLLVDSILCCLFGKGRASDIDSFVRVGKDLMQLEVDFSLNGSCYRVIRKRSRKTAKGSSMLELFEIDREGNQVKNLTAGTVAETQALIEKILGINYDVLVKSAIIEQGEADSFVEATPSERMELFSEIWDLKKYEEFSQIARDTVKEFSERERFLEERVELGQKKIEELREAVKEKGRLESEIRRIDSEISGLERKKLDYQKKILMLEDLTKEIETAKANKFSEEEELKKVGALHKDLISKIDRFNRILENRDLVFKKVEKEKEKEGVLAELENRLGELNEEINKKREEIDGLRKSIQKKVDSIREQQAEVDSEISKLRQKQFELNEEFTKLRVDEEKLNQMRSVSEKLRGLRCHPEADLFYVNEKCVFIKDAVEAKKGIPAFEKMIGWKKDELEKKASVFQSELEGLESRKRDFDSEIKGIRKEMEDRISSLETEIETKRAEARRVGEEIGRLRAELSEIREYGKLLPEVNLAEQELPKLMEEEKGLEERARKIVKNIERWRLEIESLEQKLLNKETTERSFESVCSKLVEISKQREEMVKQLGFIEASERQIEELSVQIRNDEKEREEISSKRAIYQTLEEAFKQIPYMLISRSIAVVESKANEILNLISPSGLRVEIKTEKMTKTTKKMKDEIHLIIHDSDGEKPYKFLSGGEKLRVAVSLRLALGEVFARRKGANIETLIADEIFGALDPEGVEDVKQVFRELRKKFKFIGVISHINETKDIFETQLLFEKGRNGTIVRMLDNFS
jgi:exonuclease SbcC